MSYSVSDVSEMLDVGSETVRRWIRDGKLEAKRVRGRNGNQISLEEVVRFVNRPPCLYQDVLRAWLDKQGISYQVGCIQTGANTTSKLIKSGINTGSAIAGTAAAAQGLGLGTLGIGLPILAGTVGATKMAGILLGQKSVSYQQVYLSPNSTAPEAETASDQATLPQKPAAEKCPEELDPKEALRTQIRAEKLKLLQLRQEQAQIEAQITFSEKQIEYYEILLTECGV